jgi:hypothetical protein
MNDKLVFIISSVCQSLIILLLVFFNNGCGAFYGVFIHPLIPPASVKAEHDMSNSKVLIWVDAVSLDQDNQIVQRELTQQLREELLNHQAVDQAVEYQSIARFRREHPNYVDLPIQKLGQQLKADEVLYLLIDKFQLHHEAGKGFYQTSLSGYTKVIDVSTGNRLWPLGRAHRPFTFEGKFTQGQGQSFEDRLVRELCADASQQISLNFYAHKEPR